MALSIDPPPPLGVNPRPIGMMWLLRTYRIEGPAPCTAAYAVDSGGGISDVPGARTVSYPAAKEPHDLLGHLRFALKHEPIHYGLWRAVFREIGPDPILAWIRRQPLGQYARRAWYLYELLTHTRLDYPDLDRGNYVALLDERIHVVTLPRRAKRQRVENNALGDDGYGPLVRRTVEIEAFLARDFGAEVDAVLAGVPTELLARVLRYLTTKETMASFEIESERPSSGKAERFAAALSAVDRIPVDTEAALVHLQNLIVDARYAETGFRTEQNYVGEGHGRGSIVHFVPPKPEDLHDLMANWFWNYRRLRAWGLHPIVRAAIGGFGFVFLHPFLDGNGRIHRFIFQRVLAESRFFPPGVLVPISAAILRDEAAYDDALESFSRRIMPFVDHFRDEAGAMTVTGETDVLYRYWDATATVTYLFRAVEAAIRTDLVEEIAYLRDYDHAMARVAEIVDMPNKRAALLVRLILERGGRLSKRKREEFGELTDAEIAAIEGAITRPTGEASLFDETDDMTPP